KVAAVLLYVSGLSMNRTAKLLGVSTPTIQAWLEQFAAAYAQKPEPEGRAVVIELDEMWHYLKKSPNRSGSGKLGIVLQGSWWTGNAGIGTKRVSGIGWPASGGARSWSRRPSAWWTSASPCSPASQETTGSPTSYLCSPKTLCALTAGVKLTNRLFRLLFFTSRGRKV